MLRRMVRPPISWRLRQHEVTARARRLLRRLDAEATARHRFKNRAAKAFLAASEMRDAFEKMTPGDRTRCGDEIERIESILVKISKGSR